MNFADVIDTENCGIIPVVMLRGGEHFKDIQGGRRGTNIRASRTKRCQTNSDEMPQTTMLRHIVEQDIHWLQSIQRK